MHFPKLTTVAAWVGSLGTATAVAAVGAMTVLADAPQCTINGARVAAAEAEAHPEACDPGTGPLAGRDTVTPQSGGGAPAGAGETAGGGVASGGATGGGTTDGATGGGATGGETTGTGTGTTDTGTTGTGTTDTGTTGTGTTGTGTTGGETSTGGETPVGGGTTGETTGGGAPAGDTGVGIPAAPVVATPAPAAPATAGTTPAKTPKPALVPAPVKNIPAAAGKETSTPAKATNPVRELADATAKVYRMVTYQDARTFREKYTPKGRIPDAAKLPADDMDAVLAAAKDAKVDWALLTAVSWLDSKWGNGAAGGFAGNRLDAKLFAQYATDGDGDGVAKGTSTADGLATAAALLADKREELGSMNAALQFYFGNRASHVRRARFLAAYYEALGSTGIVKGLEDQDTRDDIAERVLDDKRVTMYEGGRSDIADGLIDPRVLVTLEFLANRFNSVTVSSLVSGHGVFTASGNVSLHSFGQAVDIAEVGGFSMLGNQGKNSITPKVLRSILRMPVSMEPAELISLWDLGGPSFALADHHDHIHIGWKTDTEIIVPGSEDGERH